MNLLGTSLLVSSLMMFFFTPIVNRSSTWTLWIFRRWTPFVWICFDLIWPPHVANPVWCLPSLHTQTKRNTQIWTICTVLMCGPCIFWATWPTNYQVGPPLPRVQIWQLSKCFLVWDWNPLKWCLPKPLNLRASRFKALGWANHLPPSLAWPEVGPTGEFALYYVRSVLTRM